MFTGIISKKGTITELSQDGGAGTLSLSTELWEKPLVIGESIAINGVCLSLARQNGNELSFDILKETFDRSSLAEKTPGDGVNLERALTFGDELGGHLVQGHVDATGTVTAVKEVDRDWCIEITCGKELTEQMIYKGSVTIDGVSLTIAGLEEQKFSVHLIPVTWLETSLGSLSAGDSVNIELDVFAKYIRSMLKQGHLPDMPSWEELRDL